MFAASTSRRPKLTYGGRRRTSGDGKGRNAEAADSGASPSMEDEEVVVMSPRKGGSGRSVSKGKGKAVESGAPGVDGHGTVSDEEEAGEEVVVMRRPSKIGRDPSASTSKSLISARQRMSSHSSSSPVRAGPLKTGNNSSDSATDYDEDAVFTKHKASQRLASAAKDAIKKVAKLKAPKRLNGKRKESESVSPQTVAKAEKKPRLSPARSSEGLDSHIRKMTQRGPSEIDSMSKSTKRTTLPISSSPPRLDAPQLSAVNAVVGKKRSRSPSPAQQAKLAEPRKTLKTRSISVPPSAGNDGASRAQTPPIESQKQNSHKSPNHPIVDGSTPTTPRAQQPPRRPSNVSRPTLHAPPDLSDIFSIVTGPAAAPIGDSSMSDKPKQSRIAQMAGRSQPKTGPSHLASPSLSSLASGASETPRKGGGLGATQSAPELGSSPSHGPLSRSPSRSLLGSPSRSISRHASAADVNAAFVPSVPLDLNMMSAGAGGKARTYGGPQRSFLPDEDDLGLLQETQMEETQPAEDMDTVANPKPPTKRFNAMMQPKARESYSDLRRKWGIDEDEPDLDLVAGSTFDLRSVAEQRTSGSSKRFIDELAYLFEGLAPSEDISSRRASAIQLSEHLVDDSFLRKLKMQGLLERVYESLRAAASPDHESGPIQARDRVLDACLVFFIAVLCVEQRLAEPVLRIPPIAAEQDADPLSTDSDCLRLLGLLLADPTAKDGIGDERRVEGRGATKSEKQKLGELAGIIDRSSLRDHVKAKLSLSSLVLFSLASISTFDVRPGLRPQQAVVRSGAFGQVTTFLADTLSKLPDRVSGFSRGMNLLPSGYEADLLAIDFCVSIIETCSTCDEGALIVLEGIGERLAQGFASLLVICNALAGGRDNDTKAMLALNVLIGSLRSLINVTNVSIAWLDCLCQSSVVKTICNVIDICRSKGATLVRDTKRHSSSPESVDAPCSSQVQSAGLAFDTLCVALALLANIIEHGEEGRKLLLETALGPSCSPLNRKCALTCTCEDATSALNSVVRLYADPLDFCPSVEEKQFVSTYGRILLTLAMVDDEVAQVQVVEGLRSDGKEDIDTLLDSIRDLSQKQEDEPGEDGPVDGNEAALRRLGESLREKWEENRAV